MAVLPNLRRRRSKSKTVAAVPVVVAARTKKIGKIGTSPEIQRSRFNTY